MIEKYNRNDVPEGINHAEFGVICPTIQLTNSHSISHFTRTITAHNHVILPGGQSYTADSVTNPSEKFLAPCQTEFIDCCTGEFEGIVFPSEHAIMTSGGLLQESLWHSELFYTDWFRNDRTTNWQWRTNEGWPSPYQIEEPVNFCYHRFHYQYFHWLIDSLPRVWLLKARGRENKSAKWVVGPLDSPTKIASLGLFDIHPEDCLWQENPSVQFNRMIYSSFEFHEPIGTRPSFKDGIHHRGWWPDYLKELRERGVLRHGKPGGDLKIYITREDAYHRKIINGLDVDLLMDEFGFTRVTPGRLSFEDQIAMFSQARVIVGTHGAGMTNAIWAAPGAKLLEFMPAQLGDPGYRFLGQLCGHDYRCLFANTMEDARGIAYANIEIDIGTLRMAIRDILE